MALGFRLDLVGRLDVFADELGDLGDIGRQIVGREIAGVLGGMFGQFDDRLDDRLEAAVGEHDTAEDFVFRHFVDFGFDHHDGVVGAGNDQVHAVGRIVNLLEGRVENVLAVDEADAGRADRAHEGNAR